MRYIWSALLLISCVGIIEKEKIRTQPAVVDREAKNTIVGQKENKDMNFEKNGSIKSYQLPNGLRLIVEEDHTSPVVAIQAWVRVGSADESDDIAGIAHLHEHMLFKGTAKRGIGEIAKIIEENGGDINAWTSFDDTVYHIVMPSSRVDMGIDIITDVVMNSSFDPKELQKEKEVIIEEIRQNRDIPQRRLIDEIFRLSYDLHPYKRPVIGYPESVRSITRQKIYDFYKKYYVPANIVIVVVGDVLSDDIYNRIQKLMPGLSDEVPSRERVVEPPQRSPKVRIIKDRFVESQIGIAWHITGVKDEDTPALDLLSVLLGSSQSSKLRESVVLDKTIATDVFAYSYTPMDKGLFIVGAGLPFANIPAGFNEIFDVINKYRYVKFSTAEVNKAIVQVESDDIFSQTTMQGRARKLGFYQLMTGDHNYGTRYLNKIRGITPDDLLRMAKNYLTLENMSVVLLLPDDVKEQIISEEQILNYYKAREDFYRKREGDKREIKEIYKKVLRNGITLIVESNPRLPIVSVRTASLGGVRYEDEKSVGISYFISRMFTRGNTSLNTLQINRTMDNIGGSIGGYSGKNSIGIRSEFLSKYQDIGFKIMLDCLFRSTFSEEEIEKERRLIIEEIRNREDDLTFQTLQLFLNHLFVRHPYRYDIIGTEKSISSLKRDDIINFYKRIIVPSNVVIVVVGDVDPQFVEELIEQSTSDIPAHEFAPIRLASEDSPEQLRRVILYKEKEQAHIVVGFLGGTIYDKDRYALALLSVILEGQSGRLFLDLRDKKSLAYTVSSFHVDGLERGYFAIYLSCSQHKVNQSENAIFEEISELIKNGVTAEELERAKNYLIGIRSIEMQEYATRTHIYALDELYGLGFDYHNKYATLIKAVSTDDIKEVVNKYLNPDRAVVAVIRSQAK